MQTPIYQKMGIRHLDISVNVYQYKQHTYILLSLKDLTVKEPLPLASDSADEGLTTRAGAHFFLSPISTDTTLPMTSNALLLAALGDILREILVASSSTSLSSDRTLQT